MAHTLCRVVIKSLISRAAAAEEMHMLKLNKEKQEQMFQDAGLTKKYEDERGTMRTWKIPKARREIQ